MIKYLVFAFGVFVFCSAAVAAPLPDPDRRMAPEFVPKKFDSRHRGLTDYEGKTIVPAEYSDITYCGNGFFILTSLDKESQFEFGKERFIVNNWGKRQRFRLPEGSQLADIFSLGDSADKEIDLPLHKLPSNTLLRFSKDKKSGLCRTDGTIVLPLQRGVGHRLFCRAAGL